ncbi:MAG TPA: 3-isopropylmalate dehydrogenase, partial [Acidocella sp.]
MTANKNILLLPGDGIGPEVMAQAKRVLNWLQESNRASFTLTEDLVGGASIDAHGTPLTEAAMARALAADAVLFGSVGGPQWDNVPFSIRPEAALLRLRSELGVFANLRPAKVFDALIDSSSLKPDLVRGLDIMIVRECIGGIYFGEPRGIETLPDGTKRGINTEVYTTPEIERVGRVAFELAAKRQGRVCSVEKANVMESGLLWRQTMTALQQAEYPNIELSHMYADNCAMQLAKNPRQFDVIVTGNLFGDILSDLAAMLTGSLGMLPSATLGGKDASGRRAGFYEPIHGSAPDIAGKSLANPLAQVLSLALLLRYSFDMEEDAALIEQAVENVLAKAGRTADIPAPGRARISTSEMGDALIAELNAL